MARFTKQDFNRRPSHGVGAAMMNMGYAVPLRTEPKIVMFKGYPPKPDDATHYETHIIPVSQAA